MISSTNCILPRHLGTWIFPGQFPGQLLTSKPPPGASCSYKPASTEVPISAVARNDNNNAYLHPRHQTAIPTITFSPCPGIKPIHTRTRTRAHSCTRYTALHRVISPARSPTRPTTISTPPHHIPLQTFTPVPPRVPLPAPITTHNHVPITTSTPTQRTGQSPTTVLPPSRPSPRTSPPTPEPNRNNTGCYCQVESLLALLLPGVVDI